MDMMAKTRRIMELEQQLSAAQQESSNNQAAAEILTGMISRGEAEQDANGNVSVSKRKSDMANVIGNLEEL